MIRHLTLNAAGAVLLNTTGTEVRHQVAGATVFTTSSTSNNMADGKHISSGTTTGTKIGMAPTQKLSLWNATPVVQPAAVADVTGGTIVDVEARAALNALLARLRSFGAIAT